MNIILLSGGSGKRLWPLSNDIRSKQFIKIFRRPAGAPALGMEESEYESMVQRVYRQIKAVDPEAEVTVATSKSQVSALHNQLGLDVGISIEPCRRDTFPAIALSVAYLHDVKGIGEDEAVVVCPVDPYVDEGYFRCVNDVFSAAQEGKARLVLMGIEPTYPSAKYGYIIPSDGDAAYRFTEKPDEETAKKYIEQKALWNGGVFGFRLGYVLEKAKELLGSSEYRYLYDHYAELTKISFDYAVVEQESSIEVLRYQGTWKDLGTWNTLTEAMEGNVIGDARMNDTCEGVHVVNELEIPILVMGLKNVVISASPEGILVSDKEQSAHIKPFVDAIDQQVMFAEKSWGKYRLLDVEEDSMTVKVTLSPGHHMNYHSHDNRDEIWNVVSGTGRTVVDGMEQPVGPGDVITMAAGCKHTVIADTELQMIEIQIGQDITVTDKRKYELK